MQENLEILSNPKLVGDSKKMEHSGNFGFNQSNFLMIYHFNLENFNKKSDSGCLSKNPAIIYQIFYFGNNVSQSSRLKFESII